MKKLISMVLAVMLICSMLVACTGGENPASTGSTAENSTTETGETSTKREEPVKLVVAFMNWVGAMPNQQRVVDAMNAITLESMNIEIELQIMDSASYSQQMTLMLAGGEQVDLFNAISIGYTSSINNGYLIDLEEDNLLQTYGQGIIDTMGQTYIDACRFGGVLYGLPNQRDMAIGQSGYAIPEKYLDEIGYKYTDENAIKVTEAEIEDIYKQLHEKFPNMVVFSPQTATLAQSQPFDGIGGDNFGVLYNYGKELKVEELFGSEYYSNLCNKMFNWRNMGYISGDALTNDIAATTAVRSGSAISYATAIKPGIKAQESNLCGQPMVIFQTGEDFMRSSSVSGMPWCIANNTVDKVAAMEYLNELYTNPELSRLLCWGIEGEEYKVTEDGHLTFADGVTADTSGYLHSVNWQLPNQFIAGVFEGDDLGLWDEMKEFNQNATISNALGFSFDNSSLTTEFTALTNIYLEYQKQLEFGFVDPATGIPEMVERLKGAGLEKYMAEKQKQLDEWAANK